MRKRKWTVDLLVQGLKDEGVPLFDAEILEKAQFWEQEMRRMSYRDHYRDRKFYRNEIPCGLANAEGAYDYIDTVRQHERQQREDWAVERRRPRKADEDNSEAENSCPRPSGQGGPRVSKRSKDFSTRRQTAADRKEQA